jgi:Zn-dependent protease
MLRAWKLGTAFGIGVYLHWTFLLLPIYVMTVVIDEGGTYGAALFYALGVVGVFACVTLHEFGHALTARHFGIATRDITLYPIGGVARLERMSDKPWEEFWIALAGPAVNVAIVTAILLLGSLAGMDFSPERLASVGPPGHELFAYPIASQFLVWLLLSNAVLVTFNMLPAFPMDGGRVLRALLSGWLGHLRATELATSLGVGMAALFAFWGLGLFGGGINPMPILVALFVFAAGQQELAMLRYRLRRSEAAPTLITQRPVEWFYPLDRTVQPPEPHFSGFTWDPRASVWIEWRDGRPIQACFTD